MSSVNQRSLLPGEKIRVLVVDDSVVIRRLVANSLELDPTLELVGTASNGLIGMQRIEQLNPDVVTLDIEMPEMDGLETLRRVRREYPQLRVIMFSTLTVAPKRRSRLSLSGPTTMWPKFPTRDRSTSR